MNSYSTLDPTSRALVNVPESPLDLDIETSADGGTMCVNVDHTEGTKILIARKVGNSPTSDVCEVSVDVWDTDRYTNTVRFTTTQQWVEQWVDMVRMHLPTK